MFLGDLTDAKHADEEDSGQFFDEWAHYSNILNKTGVLKKTAWLDVRGNHGKLLCIFAAKLCYFVLKCVYYKLEIKV